MLEYPLGYELADGWVRRGVVTGVDPSMIMVRAPALMPGTIVGIKTRDGQTALAEVRSAGGAGARCVPISRASGVAVGNAVVCDRARLGAYVGDDALAQVLDAWGRAADGRHLRVASVYPPPLVLGERAPIARAMTTRVAAVDAFATIGLGQRVALTAGAGVGKTTLLRSIVAQADVDARVVALVGERARDAFDAIEQLKASPFWSTTTVVSVGADAPATERLAAARTATAQAEALCASGRRVLLAIDSLTRVATAWRELALAAGEPPAYRGYPPSLVGMLADLVERAGARLRGSITGIYVVLVDGDDQFEPVTDAIRALLDGHIALSRRLADAAKYPAIDVLRSLSRTMPAVVTAKHLRDAATVRGAVATLEQAEDLLAIGAYREGADPWLDACLAERSGIEALIFHGAQPVCDPIAKLADIAEQLQLAKGEWS